MASGTSVLSPLKDARFAWFFAARVVSTAGSVMAPVALTFAVLAIDPSPYALGQVLAGRSLALVLLVLLGGVIADRFPRSLVLVVSHALSALTQGVAAWLVITDQATVTQLLVIESANGALTAFSMPAIQGVIPQVVPRTKLQEANSLMAFTRSGLAVLGPSAAAVLVVTAGPGWGLAFDAATWLAAGACMLFVRLPAGAQGEPRRSLAVELRSGWSVFAGSTWLWVVVLACGVVNAVQAGAWATLGPTVALATPGIEEGGWGLALSGQAVGLVALTVVMMRARVMRPLRTGLLAMAGLALPMLVLGLSPSLAPLVLASFAAGAGVQVFMISWQTAIHENVPERYLSRVTAYDTLGSFAAIPIGQLLAGPLTAGYGREPVLVGSGVLVLAVVGAALAVPQVRGLSRPQDILREIVPGPAVAGARGDADEPAALERRTAIDPPTGRHAAPVPEPSPHQLGRQHGPAGPPAAPRAEKGRHRT